jgi:hypothetical protein
MAVKVNEGVGQDTPSSLKSVELRDALSKTEEMFLENRDSPCCLVGLMTEVIESSAKSNETSGHPQ